MKTKKLIELLMEADPSGEAECCIDNCDITFVDPLPGYYDGRLEILERDVNNYIIGGKISASRKKVKIHYMSLMDAISDYPELPIDLSESNDNGKFYEKTVEIWREKAKQFQIEVNKIRGI